MKQKRHTTEEIIRIIREAASGKELEAVLRNHNVSAASFYRWKKKFGGMELKDARKYRQLERENAELKQMLADSLLKIRVLEEVNAKKWGALRRSGEQSRAWSKLDSARSEGRVGTWACTVLAIVTPRSNPPTGYCVYTLRSRRSHTSTHVWATASACASCVKEAGRWVASSCNASGASTACESGDG